EEAVEKNVVYLDNADAAPLIFPDRPDYVTQVNLILYSPKDVEAVRGRLRELLGPPYHVQTVGEHFETAKDVTAVLEIGFALSGMGALVVGLFLVYNALSVSVAERRRDIGILRSVGATRGQIAGLFVAEASALGLTGSLLGLPLGYGLAWLALRPMHKVLSEVFVKLPETSISVSVLVMLLA